MKKKIRITRTNFPNTTMLYWMTYIVNILEKDYEVIIDSKNPELVFWTNLGSSDKIIDSFTNDYGSSHDLYPNAKKIYMSCEYTNSHLPILNLGEDYFAMGPEPIEHNRYLHLPIHNTTAAWGLYDESKLYDHPYNWLTELRDGDKILKEKKYFCGVVQNSKFQPRIELYEKLSKYKNVRASGGWITNVPEEEATIAYPRIDGEGYRSKVLFLRPCKFSIQVQSNVYRYLTVEKMVQAYATYSIPIYLGNDKVLNDGFNPKSFINCHDYSNFDEVVDRIIEIDNNDTLYKEIISESPFIGNKLPNYFEESYVLNFLNKVINF